jgi:hypothetical protein
VTVLMLRSLHLLGDHNDPSPGLDLPYCRSVTRRCTGVTKVKCLRLSYAGATSANTSANALPSLLLCRRHDFRTSMSALALRVDMQFDVPLSVLDVSLSVEQQALMAFLLDHGFVCTAEPHTLPSCTRFVSNFLTADGHAVCTVPSGRFDAGPRDSLGPEANLHTMTRS